MRKGAGVTLPEMLIALALFGMMMSILGRTLQLCYTSYHKGDDRAPYFRDLAVTVDGLARELRMCDGVLYPAESALREGFSPEAGRTTPLVFCRYSEKRETIAYSLDRRRGTLVRVLYGDDFNPADPQTHGLEEDRLQVRYLGRDVTSLKFHYSRFGRDEFLKLSVSASHKDAAFPLETKVGISRGFLKP